VYDGAVFEMNKGFPDFDDLPKVRV